MLKVVKLKDEELLSLGIVSPGDRAALLDSIANINSLNSESSVQDAATYHIRDTKDPKLMRDLLALTSKLFPDKKTRRYRVVIERVERVRNEPLSLAYKRLLKSMKEAAVVHRMIFPPFLDTLAEHTPSDRPVTEDLLLGGGLRSIMRKGPAGQGIYFPATLNVSDENAAVFRGIVCDVALGQSAQYDAADKGENGPPSLAGADVDSVTFAKPVANVGNAALKEDLAIKSATQALPRYVVSFRVHSTTQAHQILVVSADGSGDHRSVAEAVEAAESGDRIVLRPGTYTENLEIDTDVHIVSGAVGAATVVGTLLISAGCQLTGVNIQRGAEGDSKTACVTVRRGSPTLTECTVMGLVSVQSEAQLVLRECIIRQSMSHGVSVGEKATCLVEHCTVEDIELCGIQVEGGARGIIMNTSVSGCKQNGIYLVDGAKGVIEGCNIFSNAFPGIAINSADPVVSRNRIHHNQRSGMVIAGTSQGNTLVEENNIFENGRDGIMIAKEAICLLQGNAIFSNKGAGVQIMTGAAPNITHTRVFSNSEAGVLVSKGGSGSVRSCQIFNNGKSGLSIAKGRGLLVEECEIFSNMDNGVQILANASPSVVHNRIFEHAYNIVVDKKAVPVLEKNELFKGRVAALKIHAEAVCTLAGNVIYENASVIEGGSEEDLKAANELLE